ncbi:unnamed protein product [Oreochromis niloticus]|nr:unnamed protein product [Mustela putorius furo]
MSAVTESLCCTLLLFVCVFADQKNITAESGQDVTLTCRASNISIIVVVEWSRADLLETEYALLYRDGVSVPDHQHPSFKNRVDLQDRQMKDGDVSLILKNVTINDTGTYECRVAMRRSYLKTDPINSIYLRVVDPPGQTGGGTKDGSDGLKVGLPLLGVLLIAAAVVVF